MPTEQTPLTAAGETLNAAGDRAKNFISNLMGHEQYEVVSQNANTVLSNIMNSENTEKAGSLVRSKLEEIQAASEEGYFPLRLLSFIGGVSIIFTSAFEFLPKLLTLNLLGALIEIYTIMLGIVVLILEGKELGMPQSFVGKLEKYALFLKFMWGRGMLYFVAGSLLVTQLGLFDLICGGFMCFVGFVYISTGYLTAAKLREVRKSIYSEQTLRAKFDEADTGGTGSLDIAQFSTFINSIGVDLSRREKEAAFFHMDQNENGNIQYADFQRWWEVCDDDKIFPALAI